MIFAHAIAMEFMRNPSAQIGTAKIGAESYTLFF